MSEQPKQSAASWPSIILNKWSLAEMRKDKRRTHILRHLYNRKESWWEVADNFTRKDVQQFEELARKKGCMVWVPKSLSDANNDRWLSSWPLEVLNELDKSYDNIYKPCTTKVLHTLEKDQTFMITQENKSHGKSIMIYNRDGILVILKEVSKENNILYWATSYRPMNYRKISTTKKFQQFVRNLKEAKLYE